MSSQLWKHLAKAIRVTQYWESNEITTKPLLPKIMRAILLLIYLNNLLNTT